MFAFTSSAGVARSLWAFPRHYSSFACGARPMTQAAGLWPMSHAAGSRHWSNGKPGASNMRAMCDSAAPPDGTVMASVEKKLKAALNPSELAVMPIYGDPNGSHVSIRVVSSAFAGLNLVKRHRLVYKAIWDELSGPIHAVDELVTETPEEAEEGK